MERIWATMFSILTLLEYFSFYYVIYKKGLLITKRKARGLASVLLLLMLACVFWQEWMLDIGLVYLVSFFVMLCLFQVSVIDNFKLWLAALIFLVLVEGMMDNFIRVFLNVGVNDTLFIYQTCVIALLWIYHGLIGRKLNMDMFRLPRRIKVIVGIMAVVLVLVMNLMSFLLFEYVEYNAARVGEIFLFLGSVAVCVLLFSLIYSFNATQEYSMQAELLVRQNEQQREYFEQMLKKEQDTRQFRHDLIAELLELKNYAEEREYEKLNNYLSEMLGEISAISKRQYDVGNNFVNTIINYYFLPIRESCEIKVRGYMQEEQTVSQRDLCIIVSNLVKNATEAVERVQNQHREILFKVCQGEKSLNIHLENTLEGEVKMKGGIPVTTKADKRSHGLGLINVRSIVEKYQGSYSFNIENHRYMVDIFI